MPLSWNEIKSRAIAFTKEWKGEASEDLADLYDPNAMPPELVKAHQALDKAVDLCYRSQPFINETKRIEFLFNQGCQPLKWQPLTFWISITVDKE